MDKEFPYKALFVFYPVALSFRFLAIKTTCSHIANKYLPILLQMMKVPEPSFKNLTQELPKIQRSTA